MNKLLKSLKFLSLGIASSSITVLLGSSFLVTLQSPSNAATTNRNVIIFVADGLRYGMVNATNTPNLYNVRTQGVNFTNSHSLFPTFTTPNASAIATGHYLGDTGDFSNTVYAGYPVTAAGGSVTPFIENNAVLSDIDDHFGGNFLNEESLLAAARLSGYNTTAVGKLGPVLIQDVTQGNTGVVPTTVIVDDSTGRAGGVTLPTSITNSINNNPYFTNTYVTPGYTTAATIAPNRTNGASSTSQASNGFSGNNTTPGTLAANVVQQNYFTDVLTQAILPTFTKDSKPFAAVYWSRDPDGSQHNQGDSLNSITPGINGPTSLAGIHNADNNLGQIISYLKATDDPNSPGKKLSDTTDIFVTADHGFSTISKQQIDAQGTLTKSYAASLSYPGVNTGFLPKGFVAIDLAHGLGETLYDPDKVATPIVKGSGSYTAVNFLAGQLSNNGNGLIGGTGVVTNGTVDAKIIVAANGGSDLIYIPSGDPVLAQKVIDFLSKQDYIDGIFADDRFGKIAGALSLKDINLQGSALTPIPAIVINFKTFINPNCPNADKTTCYVEIADSGLQQGQGMHGSFSRGDTYNNMAAIGPDFKSSFVDNLPVSNADVATTLANVLNLNIPSVGSLDGRVITESLVSSGINATAVTPVISGVTTSTPAANGYQTVLNYQDLNGTRYFDTATSASTAVPEPSDMAGVGLAGLLVAFLGRLRAKKS